jgi:mono/diheme cytochrome c family protein
MPPVSGRFRRALGVGLVFFPLVCPAAPAGTNAAGLEFFESKIRPLLSDHCYKCHSRQSEKVRGGFMLDTRDGLRQGGDSGPAIVPGHPEKSLLIKAVSYTGKDLQMPPNDQKLADEQIENLRAWIKMGAPDPRAGGPSAPATPAWIAARQHWAFQPVTEPPPPKVRWRKSWIKTPPDAFVLENLCDKGLKPSPPADRRTLLRRATFDLTGLPPTPQEMDAFLADKAGDAFARVVDRLLASPHYGERWGRYWLDVARYADTKGGTANVNARMPYAYTYRDYVIRSFNEDLPFDQFILEQIAADQLPANSRDNRSLAALGFLTVGRQFFGNENDVIDDRIDVVSRGLLGLTVTCARCHDHKFDPIPTRDYYSLHGIFNSSLEPANLPLLTVPLPACYTNYLADVRTNEEILHAYIASNELAVLAKIRSETGDYLLATHDAALFATNSLKIDELVRSRKLNKAVFLRWQTNLAALEKTNSRLFAPWFAFAKLSAGDWAKTATTLAKSFVADQKLNPLLAKLFAEHAPTNLMEAAQAYNGLFAQIPTNAADNEAALELRRFLEDAHSPANPPRADFARIFLFDNTIIAKIQALRRKLVEIEATDPGAPPRAMVLRDKANPANSRIFLRGNPATPSLEAPRQFLQVLNSPGAASFTKKASGRLQLAEAIASPLNPLTARVFVNRVWQHHFGAPLVSTPSDFGVRTARPVQGKLLDYLAAHFMAEGWSIKKLHRLIMLSSVYQQSSAPDRAAAKTDPDNKCLWRMNPQRLDFEAMRDSLLFVAGQLDDTMGGQPLDITSNSAPARHTVYGLVDRQNLPGFFRAFDFANPDVSSAGRFETMVAPQALFLLNSPLLSECARGVVERCEPAGPEEEAKIRRLYEILFQRRPTRAELKLGQNYLANQPARDAVVPEPAAWQYGWGSFDEQTGRTESFNPLPLFNGTAWRASTKKTDAKLGPVQLTAVGGNPGRSNVAAIRRWVAPRAGFISISGQLAYAQTNGAGVRGRIVSSRLGLLGQWQVHNSRADASVENFAVKANDTIDFIVDYMGGGRGGLFQWAPVIEMAKGGSEELGLPHIWDAKDNFIDPKKIREPLGAWEKYAQVLLFSNEFFFIE